MKWHHVDDTKAEKADYGRHVQVIPSISTTADLNLKPMVSFVSLSLVRIP